MTHTTYKTHPCDWYRVPTVHLIAYYLHFPITTAAAFPFSCPKAIIQEHEYCIEPPFCLLCSSVYLCLNSGSWWSFSHAKLLIDWFSLSYPFPLWHVQVLAENRIITSRPWFQRWLRAQLLERAARPLLPYKRKPMPEWKCQSRMTFIQVSGKTEKEAMHGAIVYKSEIGTL